MAGEIESVEKGLAIITRVLLGEEEQFLHEIEENGLSTRHLKAIDLINALGNPTPGEIAHAMMVKKPSVTALVAELEERGLLRKVRSDVDRREYHVHLTPQGRGVVTSHARVHRRLAERLMEPLSSAERRALSSIIGRIADALGRES